MPLDLSSILDSARERVGDAGAGLSNWYANLNPDMRAAAVRGLIGAGAGAAVMGGVMRGAPRDPEAPHSVVGPALLGAALGGGAAAGIPYGLKMLSSGISFGDEKKQPLLGKATDKMIIGPAMKHPALLAAALIAGSRKRNTAAWSQFVREFRNTAAPASTEAAQDLAKVLGETPSAASSHLGFIKRLRMANANMNAGKGGLRTRRLAVLPAALGAGWLVDKYLRGDY